MIILSVGRLRKCAFEHKYNTFMPSHSSLQSLSSESSLCIGSVS